MHPQGGRRSLILSEDEKHVSAASHSPTSSLMDNNELVTVVKESRRRDGVTFYPALVRIHVSLPFLQRVHLSSTPRRFPLAGGRTGERPHLSAQHKNRPYYSPLAGPSRDLHSIPPLARLPSCALSLVLFPQFFHPVKSVR